VLALGFGEQVGGTDVGKDPAGDTRKEAEHAVTWHRQGLRERCGGWDRQPEQDRRRYDSSPSDARREQDGCERDPNGHLVYENAEPDQPGSDRFGPGAHA
jgi:hypothetical protein